MNNLSQECIEQIEKASANYLYPATFMAGGKTALLTPTIYQSAGLLNINEVDTFIQWRNLNYFYSDMGKGWMSFTESMNTVLTNTELLNIFRNQNQ